MGIPATGKQIVVKRVEMHKTVVIMLVRHSTRINTLEVVN